MNNLVITTTETLVDKLGKGYTLNYGNTKSVDLIEGNYSNLNSTSKKNANLWQQWSDANSAKGYWDNAMATTQWQVSHASTGFTDRVLKGLSDADKQSIANQLNSGQEITVSDSMLKSSKNLGELQAAVANWNTALKANETATNNAADATVELNSKLLDVYKQTFELIKTEAERELSVFNQEVSRIDNRHNLATAKGYSETSLYKSQELEFQKKIAERTQKEYDSLLADFNEKSKNASFVGTDAYYEMLDTLNSTENTLSEANITIENTRQEIKKLNFDAFIKALDHASSLLEELDFENSLLSREDAVDEDIVSLTDSGQSRVALNSVGYYSAMELAKQYGDEINRLESELKEQYNEQTKDELDQVRNLQKEKIKAAYEYLDANKDIYKELLQAQSEYFKKQISDFEELLDLQEDAYEYQKKINDLVKGINTTKKQLAILGGDTSEENRASIQKLQEQLKDSQQNLEDEQRNKLISDIKDTLSDLQNDFDDYMDKILNKITDIDASDEQIINWMDTQTAESGSLNALNNMNDNLKELFNYNPTDEFGKLTSAIENISLNVDLSTVNAGIQGIISAIQNASNNSMQNAINNSFKESFESAKQDTVNKDSNDIKNLEYDTSKTYKENLDRLNNLDSDITAKNNIQPTTAVQTANTVAESAPTATSTPVESTPTYTDEQMKNAATHYDNALKNMDSIIKKIKSSKNWSKQSDALKKKINSWSTIDSPEKHKDPDLLKLYNSRLVIFANARAKMKQMGISTKAQSYAKGSKHIDEDQLAITNENGQEIIFNGRKGVLQTLGEGDMVFTNEMSQRLWEMAKGNYTIPTISSSVPSGSYSSNNSNNVNVTFSGDMNFNNTNNPEEFVKNLRSAIATDGKTQKMLVNATLGATSNGYNSLSNRKYI